MLSGGGRGPAAARNVGWRATSARWVCFLDDDVEPGPRSPAVWAPTPGPEPNSCGRAPGGAAHVCLRDTAALVHTARGHGVSFAEVEAARVTDAMQADRIAGALRRAMGRPLSGCRLTALGLTFKAQTSDTRDSPALTACAELARSGA